MSAAAARRAASHRRGNDGGERTAERNRDDAGRRNPTDINRNPYRGRFPLDPRVSVDESPLWNAPAILYLANIVIKMTDPILHGFVSRKDRNSGPVEIREISSWSTAASSMSGSANTPTASRAP